MAFLSWQRAPPLKMPKKKKKSPKRKGLLSKTIKNVKMMNRTLGRMKTDAMKKARSATMTAKSPPKPTRSPPRENSFLVKGPIQSSTISIDVKTHEKAAKDSARGNTVQYIAREVPTVESEVVSEALSGSMFEDTRKKESGMSGEKLA